MLKEDLVARLVEKGYQKVQIREAIDDIFAEISDILSSGNNLILKGFGTFGVTLRKGHIGTNPVTHERIKLDDYMSVYFKPGTILKSNVRSLKDYNYNKN